MKIVFLNVWGAEMRESLIPYLQYQAIDTDIFCFQEATDEMKQRCADVLSGYDEISDYKFISRNDEFPQSVFVKKGVKLLSSGSLFANDMTVGLAVYVEVEVNEKKYYVCNVHGCARPPEKQDNPDRRRFSRELIDFFKAKQAPVVIGGDFNLDKTTRSVQEFATHGYRNLIEDFSIPTTRNHFAWDRYPGNEMYFSDYVFLNDRVQLVDFSVEENEVSDHLPLTVLING